LTACHSPGGEVAAHDIRVEISQEFTRLVAEEVGAQLRRCRGKLDALVAAAIKEAVKAVPQPKIEVKVSQPRLVRKQLKYDDFGRPVEITEGKLKEET
jgi:hypothetical protein